ncbi:MAG: hypothetical protein J1E06_11280 [Acutalibacter sp.]|nr:hypothetical protein [Acutalibacter sp.]
MAKEEIKRFGNLVIKMDKGATDSRDAKKPHVSFVVNGHETKPHIYLDEVDNIVGNDSDEKEAIYWLRDNKSYLIEKYNKNNK